jgi:hypothetical protein
MSSLTLALSLSRLEPDLWFEDIVVLAQLVTGQQKVPPLSEDPDDDKYVAGAIEGGRRSSSPGIRIC